MDISLFKREMLAIGERRLKAVNEGF